MLYLRYIILLFAFTIFLAPAADFTESELVYMPATVQIALFKQGLLSPVDVVKAQIARFNRTNATINAATYTHFKTALQQAEQAKKRYNSGTNRPLEGITIGLKDEHFAKGMRVTQGSLIHKNSPLKDHTDEMTQKLLDAGAIILIQTTVPEFYLSFCTNTKAWGVTRNPWNPKYSVGGSSGGSGSALAAGYVTLATGSDMAGSIRIPAALNGLYGYKPPFGEVYTELPFAYFSGTGGLARTFSDIVLLRNIIAGPTPNSVNVRPYTKIPDEYKSIKGMKIAYIAGMGIFKPASEITENIEKAIKLLEDQGAIVDKVNIDLELDSMSLVKSVSTIALSGAMAELFTDSAEKTDQMTDYAALFVKDAVSGNYDRTKLAEMERLVKKIYKNFSDNVFQQGYEVMLAPTMVTCHIPADLDVTNETITENGIKYPFFCGVIYTIPFNLLNWMPVLTVPVGITSQNMPVGMQIIGKPGATETVFRVADWYSKRAPKLFKDKLQPQIQ